MSNDAVGLLLFRDLQLLQSMLRTICAEMGGGSFSYIPSEFYQDWSKFDKVAVTNKRVRDLLDHSVDLKTFSLQILFYNSVIVDAQPGIEQSYPQQ